MALKDKIDKTIEVICDDIQKEIEGKSYDRYEKIPNMVKALAELVSTRAEIEVD